MEQSAPLEPCQISPLRGTEDQLSYSQKPITGTSHEPGEPSSRRNFLYT
jgi:hypothetical protein